MNYQQQDRSLAQLVTPATDVDGEVELFALAKTLWIGKWKIMLIALMALLAGGYYGYFQATPMFTATSVLALEERKEQVADLDSVLSGLSADAATINTEIEVMRSRELAEKLVARLDLTADPEFNRSLAPKSGLSLGSVLALVMTVPEPLELSPVQALNKTVDVLLEKLRISNKRQSYVFEISITTTSAKKSALIANTMADLYIRDQLDVKFQATEKATIWLTDRTSDLQTELENSENKVKQFLSETDLVSPESLLALNRQLKELRTRIGDTRSEIGMLQAFEAVYRQVDDTMSVMEIATLLDDKAILTAANQVQKGEIGRSRFDVIVTTTAQRRANELDRQSAQLTALLESQSKLDAEIAGQSADFVKMQQLEREATASRLIYEHFLSRLKETSVQQGIQQADARLLSKAIVPFEASAPRKMVILVLSVVVGVFLGAALVLVREVLQKGVRTVEDLEMMTGRTVVGQVPMAPTRRRRKLLSYIAEKTNSAMSEAIRNLRTTVLMSNIDTPPRIIMLTSSVPSEGKTTQSLGLSHNFAAMGKRVLLIEADIRRRTFSDYFDVPETSGLLTAVQNDADLGDVVYHDDELGIDILFGEKSKTNAADFFASDRFGAFLNKAADAYDLVIVDTPPVLAVPDARVIGQHADVILYVVRWDYTSKTQIKSGLRSFETAHLHVDGLVLSQVSEKGMKRYGYESGYGYGKGYYDS